MAIGVGAGDYAEYLPFVPPPSAEPALLFLSALGGWSALLASDQTTWEFRGSGGGFTENPIAIDVDNVENVSILQQSTDSDGHFWESTDGANNFSDTPSVAALPGLINAIKFPYRNGLFLIQVFDNSGAGASLGGEYSSPDGLTWTKTGRVNSRDFGGPSGVWPADIWGATEDHAYYVMREDPSFSGFYRSIYVDTLTGGNPQVIKIDYDTIAPTGGTFKLGVDSIDTANIAWNASAATILAALNAITSFGPGGSASGTLGAGGVTITYPYNGRKLSMAVHQGLLTGPPGNAMTHTLITPGNGGIGSFATPGSGDTPAYSFHEIWGSITGDVALIHLSEDLVASFDFGKFLWKLEGANAPVDVTPGFVDVNDSLDGFISPDGVIWLGMHYDSSTGEQRLMRSTDGGDTWALVGPSFTTNIIDVCFDPGVANLWWMIAYDVDFITGLLYKSTDNGATWVQHMTDAFFLGGNEKIIPIGGRRE